MKLGRYLKMNVPFAFASSAVTIGVLGEYRAAVILGVCSAIAFIACKPELEEVLILAELNPDKKGG